MFAKRFAVQFILLVLSIFPMTALARESSDTTIPAPAQGTSASDRAAILREIKAFGSVQISVRDVIAIAEKHSIGAKAVDISFDGRAERLVYRVKTYQHAKIWEGSIDASTGKLVGDATLTPASALDIKDNVELAGFSSAGVDLSEVVSIAEEYGDGRAVSAGLGEENGKLIFLVVVDTDGSLREISVDPSEKKSRLTNASLAERSKQRVRLARRQ
jgi:uncharacterized membrane protein YkoI